MSDIGDKNGTDGDLRLRPCLTQNKITKSLSRSGIEVPTHTRTLATVYLYTNPLKAT
jgi:hypothetical protein